MRLADCVFGVLTAAAVATGSAAISSPSWADGSGASEVKPACRLGADRPTAHGSTLKGVGWRSGCSDTVTYLWVRVYKVIDFWPDSEKAVNGSQYVQNGNLAATGSCDGRGEHYTHTSTATGVSGDAVESGRVTLC